MSKHSRVVTDFTLILLKITQIAFIICLQFKTFINKPPHPILEVKKMENFTELVEKMCTSAQPVTLFMGCVSMRSVEFWQHEYSLDKFSGSSKSSLAFNCSQVDKNGTKAIYEFFRVKKVSQ